MAHELDFTTGTAAIAYVGQKPWHNYGNVLQPGASLDEWRVQARLDWNITEGGIHTATGEGIPGHKVLTRDDSNAVLSVVTSRYNVVQPAQVLGFFKDLTEQHGYQLESAGALMGGKRFWALAKTGKVAAILGEDEIRDYLLLSTSCDGSLATSGQYTSIRVVCNNTLTYATEETSTARKVTVPHSAKFDPDKMKGELGTSTDHWAMFIAQTEALAKTGISVDQAVKYFLQVLEVGDVVSKSEQRKVERLMHEWTNGVGADMTSAHGTAWGLVNTISYATDHAQKERIEGSRQNRAWFGDGAVLKQKALNLANQLVTA